MGRSHPFPLAAIILLGIFGMLFTIINPLVMRVLVDDVLMGGNTGLLIPVLVVMGLVFLISALSNYTSARIKATLDLILFTELSSRFFNSVQKSSLIDLQKFKTGDLQLRTTGNIGAVIQTITSTIPQIVITMAGILLPVAIMFSLDPGITMIILLPAFLFVWSSWYFGNKTKTRQRPSLDSNARLQSFLKEAYSTIPLIKTYRLETWVHGKYDDHLSDYNDTSIEVVKVSSMNAAATMILYSIPTILVVSLGSLAVMRGSMTLGTLTAFIGYVGLFFSPINTVSLYWNIYKNSQASYERIDEVLQLPADTAGSTPLAVTKGEVEFQDIGFGYDSRIILDHFQATFTPGCNYLIGDNGSGKTTVARLLCGLYLPNYGTIRIDGQDISDVSRESLRGAVSVVFSESLLFDGTVADNILFGNISATKEEMIRAAKKAELHDFIMKLPRQYESRVGESGLNLSSGEKQKIALSRVILRDTPIIVFDEFTKSIDRESKRSILSSIRQLTNKTIIIITHDMNDVEVEGHVVIMGKRDMAADAPDNQKTRSIAESQKVHGAS